ncbi:MAG TPA: 3-hydroxyacyl-CoA dehydrogenase NAD-binding domain-containing protein, partial [Acidimicrobiales bacterium]|nr:3-hydroxyacyl-CoA dehydrogenase NAD-binding domain-containing protein [Acidimicrobiales bacterium]
MTERVGVVGAGLMGSGIAEVCARADLDVLVAEIDGDAVANGRRRIATSLARAVKAGKLPGDRRDRALDHLTFTTDLDDLGDRQVVVEAIVEAEEEKVTLFERLDKVVD